MARIHARRPSAHVRDEPSVALRERAVPGRLPRAEQASPGTNPNASNVGSREGDRLGTKPRLPPRPAHDRAWIDRHGAGDKGQTRNLGDSYRSRTRDVPRSK